MSAYSSEPQSDNPDRREFCKRTATAGGGLVIFRPAQRHAR